MNLPELARLGLNAADVLILTRLPYAWQSRINDRRLKKILTYAREKSPYYRELIPQDCTALEDIPVTDKRTMIENFDRIVTDPRLNKDFVIDEMRTHPNTHKILGRYSLAVTSGSTGTPALSLQDESMIQRLFVSLIRYCYFPCVMLCKPGYGILNTAHDANADSKLVGFLSRTFSSQVPPKELAEKINRARPGAVMTYGSLLENVADLADEGLLHISPKVIMASGDRLAPSCRERLRKHYPKAQVLTCYACTEGGMLAVECKEGHMHIREDLVRVQPVDREGRPVADGVVSDGAAVTSYFNFVQPVIRYVMDDRICMHHGCPCGNPAPWIELEGRSYENWNLRRPDGTAQTVATQVMDNILTTVTDATLKYFSTYQLVFHEGPDNLIEFRLNYFADADRQEAQRVLQEHFNAYFDSLGVQVKYLFADIPPQITTYTGKLKCFLIEREGEKAST